VTAWIDRLKQGLARTRAGVTDAIARVVGRGPSLGATQLEEIEEILISGDVGARLAAAIVGELGARLRRDGGSAAAVLATLKALVGERLAGCERAFGLRQDGEPTVALVAGVNGSGKTTTIAKLASHLRERDPALVVTLAAADTFRAAAIEQLTVWAERVGADVVKHQLGADPSAVVFDALERARRRGGVLLIDTAGRLQTKHNLMEELKKIERTVEKRLGRPSDERLLVVDATTGQNAISQASLFHEAIGLTGLVLTKLDGTAKGGVVLSIWEELKLPILYIGVGETREDLHEFSAREFVDALFGS
jgi:fused signal recognition particle receptor